LRADDCCIGRKESSSADTSEHASEKEGSKRPLEKAEAAAGARCGDLRALLHDGFAKRLLSQEGEPPSASTTDREALRDFERSEKAKRLCLEKEQDKRFLKKEEREKRQADLEWWTNLLALKQEEKKEEKEKLKEEQEKRRFLKKEEREKRQANLECWPNSILPCTGMAPIGTSCCESGARRLSWIWGKSLIAFFFLCGNASRNPKFVN